MVKVSIIIPAYNVETYIERCVSSALKQTLKDIEVIVIDDGSTDNTYNKICEFNDSRLVLIHQDNAGAASARNRGIELATGEYIGFIDGDDWVDLRMYEILYSVAKKTNAEIVNAKHCIVQNDKPEPQNNNVTNDKTTGVQEYFDKVVYSDDEIHSIIQKANQSRVLWFAWKGIYKTSMIRKESILFPTNLDLGEDTLFVLQCMLCSNVMVSVNRQLYYYVQRKGSATKKKYRTGYFEKLNSLFQEKIKIYNRYDFKEYSNDLNSYTMSHTIPMILSNELVSGKNVAQQRQAFIKMRKSEMFSEAFKNCSLSSINSRLMYLAGLLKYRQYALLALICTLSSFCSAGDGTYE